MAKKDTRDEHIGQEQGPPEQSQSQEEQVLEADILQLYEQIQKLQDERDQVKEQALRTMADFQNYRRRNQQEQQQYRQFATEDLIIALLPVLDNFDRAVSHVDSGASVDSLLDGMRAIERQLKVVLEGRGVQRMKAVGEQFNPMMHEALEMVPSDEQPENAIIEEIEPGYRLGDKVIRPARVRVARRA